MIEEKLKHQGQGSVNGDEPEEKQSESVQNGNGFIVMQSVEAEQLENLRNALSAVQKGIERLDSVVLAVEERERAAIAAVEQEFGALTQRLNERQSVLVN